MNYTKGEWMVEHQNRRIFIGNGEVPICDLIGSQDQEANARLIAAAPELYEALKDITVLLEDIKPFGDRIAQQISANAKCLALEKIREALAKVEGGK